MEEDVNLAQILQMEIVFSDLSLGREDRETSLILYLQVHKKKPFTFITSLSCSLNSGKK